jgi:hypothetical protein
VSQYQKAWIVTYATKYLSQRALHEQVKLIFVLVSLYQFILRFSNSYITRDRTELCKKIRKKRMDPAL